MTTETKKKLTAGRALAAQAMSDLAAVVRIAKTNPEARQAFINCCDSGSLIIDCAVDAEQGPVFTLASQLAAFLENGRAA